MKSESKQRAGFKSPMAQAPLIRRACVLSLFYLVINSTLLAQQPDKKESPPIEIEAQRIEYADQQKTMILKGQVWIRQADSIIEANHVIIKSPDDKTRLIEATGQPVKFQSQNMDETKKTADGKPFINRVRGQARTIDYNTQSEKYVLKGDALLIQNDDRIEAEHIIYDGKNQHYVAENNTVASPVKTTNSDASTPSSTKRVRIYLKPKEDVSPVNKP